MAQFSEELKRVIEEYRIIEQNKNHIEDKTAYVIMNAKYYENLRHAFSHLVAGLEFELDGNPEDKEKIKEQYIHVRKHMSDLDVNGYEYLAGFFLTEIRERIEAAGFFSSLGRSENLQREAIRHFDKGRDLRVAKKQEAMKHFESCIDLCMEGLREIVPVPKVEKRALKVNIASLVTATIAIIITILVAIFK